MHEVISPFLCFQIAEPHSGAGCKNLREMGRRKVFSFLMAWSDKKCMARYETENLCVKSLALLLCWLNNGIGGQVKKSYVWPRYCEKMLMFKHAPFPFSNFL